ncbi:Bug family tripartite tricarboxylate transporter substrate binding protein [Ramlibacter sp.]|uniref:Bug family tripartite tricarboxylate transporter substrate binding protein n=1 Tax=Ramlibacter sp. TaxID=1917967 RepID=UPI003D0F8149
MNRRTFNSFARASVAAATLLLTGAAAFAQAWPQRPITFVAPLAAGSPTDALARMVGDELGRRLGQPIVVDNKAGGGSLIATSLVQQAKPDGYTFLFAVSAHTINPAIRKSVKYDPIKDFTPIALMAAVPHVLVVGKDVPANNIQQLIALAKASPGKLTYGSAGIGISNHMEGELLAAMAGINIVHVPYKSGSTAAMQDVLAGRVDMMFDVVGSSTPLIKAGRVKPIGVALGRRSKLMPDIPTLDEAGLKGFQAMPWIGLFGPAGLDPAIVEKMAKAVQDTLADPKVSERLANYGTEAMFIPPAQFVEFVRGDQQKWAKIARDAKIQLDE